MRGASPNTRIRATFFDLGGVLVEVRFDRFVAALARETGIAAAELPGRLEALRPDSQLLDSGAIDGGEFHRRLIRHLQVDLEWSRFHEIYTDIFSLNEAVAGLAQRLRPVTRLSIISNTDPLHYGYIVARYPVFSIFEQPVTSFSARALKPDPGIFQYALQRLEVAPPEALFIDDLAANTAAAQAMGMHAIHFEDAGQLQEQLAWYFPRLLD
ncbi:MAG TPA: HAD-IA family hydrolase [bacterium]|nr:HAD-IA family hydrolase [bacterium]HPR88563.1 HAD-IA family hydrolase [bacterium]